MANKITKISDTELEFEEKPEKWIMTREQIEERIVLFQKNIAEYQDMLKMFN